MNYRYNPHSSTQTWNSTYKPTYLTNWGTTLYNLHRHASPTRSLHLVFQGQCWVRNSFFLWIWPDWMGPWIENSVEILVLLWFWCWRSFPNIPVDGVGGVTNSHTSWHHPGKWGWSHRQRMGNWARFVRLWLTRLGYTVYLVGGLVAINFIFPFSWE